jgi:hypothetical protein
VCSNFGADIHEPPTQTTFGSASQSRALAGVMPPVGQNRMPGNGDASARR